MIPESKMIISYGNCQASVGDVVSVSLNDRQLELVGEVELIQPAGFAISIAEDGIYWIDYKHVKDLTVLTNSNHLKHAASQIMEELSYQDQWYDALVASIQGCLREHSLSKDLKFTAIAIARRKQDWRKYDA